jgi:serine/threonine protein kinase
MAGVPQIDGYEDLVEVGRGGFAVVYRGRQRAIDRDVALKVLTRLDVGAAEQRGFEKECAAMGRVSHHRNIVVVYDAGSTAEGYPYLAMEYLPGGSLAGRLAAEGPLGWARVAGYGAGLAAALASAHEAGILHRDVKPANTLIGKDDEVKLCDFGIAALVDGTQTEMGVFKGTIAHAAPEVLDGGEASELSDVYSLGSMMYELVAGRPPYARDSDESVVALMTRALRDPVPDLGAHGAPPAFAAVVAEAMAKDPAERVPSAQALADRLEPMAASASAAGGEWADTAATVVVPRADPGADITDPGAQPPEPVPPVPPPDGEPPPVPPEADESERSGGLPWPAVGAVVFGVLAVVALVAFLAWPDSSDGPGPATTEVAGPPTPDTVDPDVEDLRDQLDELRENQDTEDTTAVTTEDPDGTTGSGVTRQGGRISFEPGATSDTVTDSVLLGERVTYTLEAAAGQTFSVSITSVEGNAVFDLIGPGLEVLASESTGMSLTLPTDGDYTVVVGSTRGNASYTLRVDII